MEHDNTHLSMMCQWPWTQQTNHRLPKRFWDEVPQPPPPLLEVQVTGIATPPPLETTQDTRSRSLTQHVFTSAKNTFGLFCWYPSASHPTYGPDDHLTVDNLSNMTLVHKPTASFNFYPYPNQSTFVLGDWFWNGGASKPQASFNSLLDIIGDPEFNQNDIQDVNWDHVNRELGAEDMVEWLDKDAGWTSTPVSISVPFQPCHGVPSPIGACARNYAIGEFHH